MIKKKTNSILQEYLDTEYNMETNKLQDTMVYSCSNCGKNMTIQYDEDNNPVSLWCDECRQLEFKIKKKFKMENKKDPYMALAQMKVLMEKTKPFWGDNNSQLYPSGFGLNNSADILKDISKILQRAKIPEKYMIAESLD